MTTVSPEAQKRYNDSEKGLTRSQRWRRSPAGQESARRHYEANKEKIRARSMARKKRVWSENKETFENYKAALGCQHCPEDDPCCLDFHHKDATTKSFNVSQSYSHSLERLWDEVSKCVVLCANCHRKEHHKEREGGVA